MQTPQKFISRKQLAAKYGVHPNTLNRELRMIKQLKLRKFQRVFNVMQLKIIFTHLGNPFEA